MLLAFVLNAKAQSNLVITPNGVCVDSLTGKNFIVIPMDGTQSELYQKVLKTVNRKGIDQEVLKKIKSKTIDPRTFRAKNVDNNFVDPKNDITTIENDMISLTTYRLCHPKYMVVQTVMVEIKVVFEFRDERIKVSSQWIRCWDTGGSEQDNDTILTGSWGYWNKKKGIIKNQDRYLIYNAVANDLVNEILNDNTDNEW